MSRELKTHKHAVLIHAWAEGAEIESKQNGTGVWISCLNPNWLTNKEYRKKVPFKPSLDDWKRVIDKEFYVVSNEVNGGNHLLKPSKIPFDTLLNSTVVREVGLRQPHFQGDKHPKGNDLVFVKYNHGDRYSKQALCAGNIQWYMVSEYIILGAEE